MLRSYLADFFKSEYERQGHSLESVYRLTPRQIRSELERRCGLVSGALENEKDRIHKLLKAQLKILAEKDSHMRSQSSSRHTHNTTRAHTHTDADEQPGHGHGQQQSEQLLRVNAEDKDGLQKAQDDRESERNASRKRSRDQAEEHSDDDNSATDAHTEDRRAHRDNENAKKKKKKHNHQPTKQEKSSHSDASHTDSHSDSDSDSDGNGDSKGSTKHKKMETNGKAQKWVESGTGDSIYRLGIGKIFVSISDFHRNTFVHIREYYDADGEGKLMPAKKGIALNMTQWKALKDAIHIVDAKLKEK